MATVNLTFDGVDLGSYYHQMQILPTAPLKKIISYPDTVGHDSMLLGSRPDGFRKIVFGEEGDRKNRFISASKSTIDSVATAVALKWNTNARGTLRWSSAGQTFEEYNMEIMSFSLIRELKQASIPSLFHQEFAISFGEMLL